MKCYVLIKLSNDLYVENTILGVCGNYDSSVKLSVLCQPNDYEIKEYEVIE